MVVWPPTRINGHVHGEADNNYYWKHCVKASYKWLVNVTNWKSPRNLYWHDISSFEKGSKIYNQVDVVGFIYAYMVCQLICMQCKSKGCEFSYFKNITQCVNSMFELINYVVDISRNLLFINLCKSWLCTPSKIEKLI